MAFSILSFLELITYISFCILVLQIPYPIFNKKNTTICVIFFITLLGINNFSKDLRLLFVFLLQITAFVLMIDGKFIYKIKLFLIAGLISGFFDILLQLFFNMVFGFKKNFLTEIISILFLNILWIIICPKMRTFKSNDELTYFPRVIYINIYLTCLSSSIIIMSLILFQHNYTLSIKLLVVAVSLISLLLSIYTIAKYIQNDRLKCYYLSKSSLLEHNLQIQKDYFDNVYKQYEDIRGIKHDLNAHLYCISSLILKNNLEEALKYIEHIQTSAMHITKDYLFCTDPYISAILYNLNSQILSNQIKFEFLYLLPCELIILPEERCSLYYNLLLNSIESCEKVKGNREIKFITDFSNNTVLITVINTVNNNFDIDGFTKRETTKTDKIFHGLGMKNIDKIIDKYGGKMNTELLGDKLKISILLYNSI